MNGMWKTRYVLLAPIFVTVLICAQGNLNVTVDSLSVGTTKTYCINSTIEYLIEILNLTHKIEEVPPRIFLQCEECLEENPLLIVIRQGKGALSWELPVVIKSKNHYSVYNKIERTLCPYETLNQFSLFSNYTENNISSANSVYPVTISLTTSSSITIKVQLGVHLQENFLLQLNGNTTVDVTPSSPYLFLFKYPSEDITSVLLSISSEDDTCMVASVQNVSCPVFDLEENVQYRGYFETITRRGGFTLTKEKFPFGFYIVLIVSGEDNYCFSSLLGETVERSKEVTLNLSKTISSAEYKFAVLITLLIIILFCIMMFVFYYCWYIREKKLPSNLEYISDMQVGVEFENCDTIQSFSPTLSGPCAGGNDTLSIKTDSSLDEIDYDIVEDAESDKNIFRLKENVYVCDLAKKNHYVLKKKSEMYFWNLLTVAIFYFLPVIQLVVTNQHQLNQSGRQDLCYYNFLCSHPLWFFSDFNHVFSNIGYLLFGSLFMVLTLLKEKLYKIKFFNDRKLYKYYGVPQHFGLFYAMGAALVIEGVLSACYHICPNHYNFQFDSSFMYVICTLCMIKIYQARHPDINASAYSTFFMLAGVIVIGMCGVFNNNFTFWIVFTMFHLSTCAYISLQIYYMGTWKFRCNSVVRFFRELQTCLNWNWKFFVPIFPSRFLLLILANACNWGLAFGSFWLKLENFSSYLLTIFMVNLMLYTTFYIFMKYLSKEKLFLQSVVYISASILLWSLALYFFFSKTTSWRLTPAASKLYNQPCKIFSFYDNHDIWHFISAAAMFSSFMVLLTLDDDLSYVHRSTIVVF